MEFSEENEKEHVHDEPDPEPSSSDSSRKKKKRNKKKNCCKHRKYDLSDPPSSDNSELSDDSDDRNKRRKKKSHQKKYLIKLCACLTAKLLTTAYKSKIIRFELEKDPFQHRIYFLTFVESLEMIFSQYTETCEAVLDYPKIGGDHIEDYAKKDIRNLLHQNIDAHIRRFIDGFPMNGIKCIEKLQ